MFERGTSRLLFVAVALFVIAVFTLALGFLLLAVVDLIGTGLFFFLWARRYWIDSFEDK